MSNHPNRSQVEQIRALRLEYLCISALNRGVIRGAVDTAELQAEITRRIQALTPRQRKALDKQPL